MTAILPITWRLLCAETLVVLLGPFKFPFHNAVLGLPSVKSYSWCPAVSYAKLLNTMSNISQLRG